MSYLNQNGLVDGNIPAGDPCPFWQQCKMRNERCPIPEQTKTVPYSCAAARLHSLIREKV